MDITSFLFLSYIINNLKCSFACRYRLLHCRYCLQCRGKLETAFSPNTKQTTFMNKMRILRYAWYQLLWCDLWEFDKINSKRDLAWQEYIDIGMEFEPSWKVNRKFTGTVKRHNGCGTFQWSCALMARLICVYSHWSDIAASVETQQIGQGNKGIQFVGPW